MSMVVTPLASHRARTVDWTQESGCAWARGRAPILNAMVRCMEADTDHRCGCVILGLGCRSLANRRCMGGSDAEGVAALSRRVEALSPALIVLEASGGYESEVVGERPPQGSQLWWSTHDSLSSPGPRAGWPRRTIDAMMLARFGEAVKPPVRELPGESEKELRGLIARRRQIVGMITAERNRRSKATVYVQRQIEQHIAWLRAQLDHLDKDLGDLIQSSSMWRVKDDLLRSVPGVGPVASSVLLVELPELPPQP